MRLLLKEIVRLYDFRKIQIIIQNHLVNIDLDEKGGEIVYQAFENDKVEVIKRCDDFVIVKL